MINRTAFMASSRRYLWAALLVLPLLLALLPQAARAAGGDQTIFLKVDGISGESTAKAHVGEIEVLSFSQSLTNSGAVATGGGGGAGKVTFSDIRFRKGVDKASIPLMLAVATGKHYKKAVFTFRSAGEKGSDYYKVTLEDVVFTGVKQVASAGQQGPLAFDDLKSAGTEGLVEEVSLNFAKIEWEYFPANPDGSRGAPVKGGYDLKNVKQI